MAEDSIPTWNDILNEIKEWEKPVRQIGYPVWYRGHANADWQARSSLHRHILNCFERVPGASREGSVDLLREIYAMLYFKFKARGWRFLEPLERSPWGIVFSMQHYGLPTLLLDWTESFACALYFAQQARQPDQSGAIYLLNPQRLNYESLSSLGEYYRQNQIPGQVDAAAKSPASAWRSVRIGQLQ